MKNYTIYNSTTTKSRLFKATSIIQIRKLAMNGKINATKKGVNLIFSGNVTDDVPSKELEKSLLGTMVYHGKNVGWVWIGKKNYSVNRDGTLIPLTKEKKATIMSKKEMIQ